MWPFKKKIKEIELKRKYRIEKVKKDYVIYKYSCTIKMQNGEIFKTDIYDELDSSGSTSYQQDDGFRYFLGKVYINEPNTSPYDNWNFDYQGTIMKLNREQISWVHHTKIPFETRQVEEDTLVLIEETPNE